MKINVNDLKALIREELTVARDSDLEDEIKYFLQDLTDWGYSDEDAKRYIQTIRNAPYEALARLRKALRRTH